jgi:hypothetical protein
MNPMRLRLRRWDSNFPLRTAQPTLTSVTLLHVFDASRQQTLFLAFLKTHAFNAPPAVRYWMARSTRHSFHALLLADLREEPAPSPHLAFWVARLGAHSITGVVVGRCLRAELAFRSGWVLPPLCRRTPLSRSRVLPAPPTNNTNEQMDWEQLY